jgi:hypothetical protein
MVPNLLSDQLKATLFPDALQDQGNNVLKEKCSTLQHFNYCCQRSRDDAGFPYGPTNTTVMSFTVRLVRPEEGTLYHQRLTENDPYDYTFLFNATFNEQQRLKGYDNMLVVNGFLIDVEDDFCTGGHDKDDRQMLIHVKLLVNSITYKGKTTDKTLEISS